MTWLALLISIAYVPGWTGISIPTGWAAMSLTLPWVGWRFVRPTWLHWLGAVFILYAVVSISWAPNRLDAVNELWHLGAIAFAFLLGSRVDLAPLWRGLAIGVTISSAIAIMQWLYSPEWQILPTSDWSKPPGLFFNNAVAGAVATIVMISVRDSLWFWGAVPLFIFSQSRGAWLALGVTTFLSASRIAQASLACLAFPVLLLFWPHFHSATDEIRLSIWTYLATNLTWFGHGAGSLMSVYLLNNYQLFHIEHAHNDYLGLVYTYGLGTIPLFAALAILATQRQHREWPAFIACLILAVYFWPLEAPVTAFAFALVAGRMCADTQLAWADRLRGRLGLLYRNAHWSAMGSAKRQSTIPV